MNSVVDLPDFGMSLNSIDHGVAIQEIFFAFGEIDALWR